MTRTPKPSIYEVARTARVSIATVSRVVNGRPEVTEGTRKRVEAALERLGYRPHPLARGLASRRSESIGLVITDILNPYFADIVRGTQDAAEEAGFTILLGDTSAGNAREDLLVRRLLERRVDGLIVASSRTSRAYADLVTSAGIPVVAINGRPDQFPASVRTDNARGTWLAVEHLVAKGHRRIGHIAGDPGAPTRQERLGGYRKALAAARITYDPELVVTGGGSVDDARAACATLLDRREPPTAILAFNDLSAVGCYQAIRARGLRVADDVSVVGFDDIVMATWLDPPLTTIAQPRREMGRIAVTLLLTTLRGEPAPDRVVVLPWLVERASTGPALARTSPRRLAVNT